jgi:L-amino acid N-acyltransferase YncA
VIRRAVPADAAAIAAIYAPHVTAGIASFEEVAPDTATIAARMEGLDGLHPWLVWDKGGVLAYAYASSWSPRAAYRWTVETTIYVADAGQGRGIGRRLYSALLATLTRQGFAQAIGRIALPNAASVALHEALGFACVGVTPRIGWKHGRWIDVGQWRRDLATQTDPPAEPIRFSDLKEQP